MAERSAASDQEGVKLLGPDRDRGITLLVKIAKSVPIVAP